MILAVYVDITMKAVPRKRHGAAFSCCLKTLTDIAALNIQNSFITYYSWSAGGSWLS